MANKVEKYWDLKDTANLSNFLYGAIFHLMGHPQIAMKFLSEPQDGSDDEAKLSRLLLEHIEAQQAYNWQPTLREKADDPQKKLKIIFKNLFGEGNGKNRDDQRCVINLVEQIIINKEYYDDEGRYRRKWFQSEHNVIDKQAINERIEGIAFYLLRAYCYLSDAQRIIGGNIEASKKGP